jgi:hypothetical protein
MDQRAIPALTVPANFKKSLRDIWGLCLDSIFTSQNNHFTAFTADKQPMDADKY